MQTGKVSKLSLSSLSDTDTGEKSCNLQQLVLRSPALPGCYLWKDNKGEVIYIGKAKNLRARLKSYLNENNHDIKTEMLMSSACDLEWIITGNEIEALLLEANLVKKHNPRYNVRLKDDKRYPYICVSTADPYPLVFLTRTVKNKKNRYFGPYTNVRAARNTLALIHKIFPVRKTSQKLPLKKPRRPCINYHIKRCLGPCQGNIPIEEYSLLIDEIILFLEGRQEILEKLIQSRMNESSKKMKYEQAAQLRDMLENVQRTTERQNVMTPGGYDYDIIAIARQNDQGQIVIMEIREGRLLGRKSFPLAGVENAGEEEIISAFIRDHFLQITFVPEKIFVPIKLVDKNILCQALMQKSGRQVKINWTLTRETRALMELAARNAGMVLRERILATKYKSRQQALEQLRDNLKLPEIPGIIEGYDISHTQGLEPVGAGVSFLDGQPHPSAYRTYRIKNIKGINDPAMIQEVIARRLQYLLNDGQAIPDLIIIDGGYIQLTAACQVAKSLGIGEINIISLAKKREELYLPGRKVPLKLDPNMPAMKLLRHIRDEAHRTGIKFHRKRRNKILLKHVLEEIPGIGQSRKLELLKHFTSKKIENATTEEIAGTPGIGPALAKKIRMFLDRQVTV